MDTKDQDILLRAKNFKKTLFGAYSQTLRRVRVIDYFYFCRINANSVYLAKKIYPTDVKYVSR